jgi:hypothetical protein
VDERVPFAQRDWQDAFEPPSPWVDGGTARADEA